MRTWYVFIAKGHVTGLLHAEVSQTRHPHVNTAQVDILSCLGPFTSSYDANTFAHRLNDLLDYQEGSWCYEAHDTYERLAQKAKEGREAGQ